MATKATFLDQIKRGLKEQVRNVAKGVSQPAHIYTPDFEFLVSFVHAYDDGVVVEANRPMPSLWSIGPAERKVLSYPFPRSPEEFHSLEVPVVGKMPKEKIGQLTKLPRYGFTGLTKSDSHIYAGSWNGVYQIRRQDFGLDKFITHPLMNDMHGIHQEDGRLYAGITSKDTIVITSIDGELLDAFTVRPNLEVVRDSSLHDYDWRFISKQKRGSAGFFHFNYIQKFGDDLYLTSRNLSCFVVVNLITFKSHLRSMNFSVPNLIHDGLKRGDKYYFTSIDGWVFIASASEESENPYLANQDLSLEKIRLKRMPNWCRGIEVHGDTIITLVDGRYGTGLTFGVQAINHKGQYLGEIRLKYQKIDFFKKIYYMTGFDLLKL